MLYQIVNGVLSYTHSEYPLDTGYFSLLDIISLKDECTLYNPCFSANQITSYNVTDQSHCFIHNTLREHTVF